MEPYHRKKKIPIIQLTHDEYEDVNKENNELFMNQTPKSMDFNESMDDSNSNESEQQHTLVTSEYSSLSSLSSPPLSFSPRLPPDGQEYQPLDQNINNSNYIMSTVPLPKTDSTNDVSKLSTDNSTAVANSTDNSSSVANDRKQTRKSTFWRKSANTVGSVQHKIAVFSSAQSTAQPFRALTKTFKSSDNVVENSKPCSIDKKIQLSKSCQSVNKISDRESETLNDLKSDECCASNHTNDESKANEVSTPKMITKLHTRSQSLMDMSNLDTTWNNLDSRRNALNTLIEQRRRGISKLRGLVIPQAEQLVSEPVLDLPEIRVKEINFASNATGVTNRSQSENSDASSGIIHQRSNSGSLQSVYWKQNSISNVPNLPRYSPAFKRKCLQVYVMEQSSSGNIPSYSTSRKISDSAFSSDCDLNNASLTSVASDNEVFRKTSVCSDNSSLISVGETQKNTKSGENMSPSNSDISFEYSFRSTNSSNSIETQMDNRPNEIMKPPSYVPKKSYTGKNKIDMNRLEDDSDNDSAVSSSQSSYISRECSPLPSPMHDYVTSTNISNDGFTNSNKSNDVYTTATNGSSGRVLKPQSVEAINRKNILASAKCRSGKDFKNGSPLIQRKNNGSEDEKLETGLPKIIEREITEIGIGSVDEPDMQATNYLSKNTSTPATKIETITGSVETDRSTEPTNQICINIDSPIKVETVTFDTEVAKEEPFDKYRNVTLRKRNKICVSAKTSEKPTSIVLASSSRYDVKQRVTVTDIRKQFENIDITNQKSPSSVSMKLKPSSPKTTIANTFIQADVNAASPVKEVKALSKIDKKSEPSVLTSTLLNEEIDILLKKINAGLETTSFAYVNPNDIVIIEIQRETSGGSIGVILTGGTDYESKEIIVHKVLTGSCADKDGRLKKGDRVLSINGKCMIGITHKESVEILKDPKPDKITLIVSPNKGKTIPVSDKVAYVRKINVESSVAAAAINPTVSNVQPSTRTNVIRVELLKVGSGLGFSLEGGRNSPNGDKPLIIKKLFSGGAAKKCGSLQPEDELIEINNVDVTKFTRIEVWGLMRKLSDGKVSLSVRR